MAVVAKNGYGSTENSGALGDEMYRWAVDLWPVPRSLTGDGVRATLQFLKEIVPELVLHEIPSGTPALDWTVPKEWSIRSAYIQDQDGHRIVDWEKNNLGVVGYSVPFSGWLSRHELDQHLHSLSEKPDAIPYVTSYYEERWGFCVPHVTRESMLDDWYYVNIDSSLSPGSLSRGEVFIPGESDDEIVLTSYICHPAMANNELSGPVVLAALARWLAKKNHLWFSYRFLFGPETIGALVYLQDNLKRLKERVRAGWVVTCVGDDGPYSVVPTRVGNTLADRVLLQALRRLNKEVSQYSWNDRGSDERQWCAPGVDLPMSSFTRSKYGTYPEYHTSLDDLNFISPEGLEGSLSVLQTCVLLLEDNPRFFATCVGEPQMSKRGLYPSLSAVGETWITNVELVSGQKISTRDVMNVLSMCDGNLDLGEIAERIELNPKSVKEVLAVLERQGLVARHRPKWQSDVRF